MNRESYPDFTSNDELLRFSTHIVASARQTIDTFNETHDINAIKNSRENLFTMLNHIHTYVIEPNINDDRVKEAYKIGDDILTMISSLEEIIRREERTRGGKRNRKNKKTKKRKKMKKRHTKRSF